MYLPSVTLQILCLEVFHPAGCLKRVCGGMVHPGWQDLLIVGHHRQVGKRLTFCQTSKQLLLSKLNRHSHSFWKQYSSGRHLIKIVSWIVRLIDRHCDKHPISNTLTATELRAIEIRLIKLIQQESYSSEMQQLARGKTLQSNSALLPLQPFIDSTGVLRVGERLENSCLVQKHPAILPRSHPAVELLLIQVHLDNKHAGNTNMLGLISQDWHICGVKRLLRKILHQCITCRKEYAV